MNTDAPRESLPWPDSTFIPEGEGARHFLGSHWKPFAEDSTEILKRLPEFLGNALVQAGYGEFRKPPRAVPGEWPHGLQLVWPLRVQGLAMVVRTERQGNTLVSVFPFFVTGSQQTLTLRDVVVWESGVEAQITAGWGEGEITFFDTQFTTNRGWYEAGRRYDFILSGIAYDARPAEDRKIQFNHPPEVLAALNLHRRAGEPPRENPATLSFEGAAVFLPIRNSDADDYNFRAPVKSVEKFEDWLGQDGWRVRATVMRFGDEDGDLDILITERAWSGKAPPRVGQDIEGGLWLQGYLWMARDS